MTMNRSIKPADNDDYNETKSYPLLKLPEKMISGKIDSNFSLKDYSLFARTPSIAESVVAFLRLLANAVEAKPESRQSENATALAAMAILKKYPVLLFQKGWVIDHFGRKIWASPYQLFLGAGDIWALRQVHGEIITNIEDGEVIAKTQFQEQFPNCSWPLDLAMGEEALYDDRNIAQIAAVINQLKIVVEKISADPCTNGFSTLDETTDAVAALRQIFVPKKGEVIKTGLHFPLGILKEIFNVYETQFNPWSGAQLAFYSREIIGAVEAALTAVDGQCCKNGLKNIEIENGPDRRDGLFCRHPDGIPAKLTPINHKLGCEIFVDPYNGDVCYVSATPWFFDWYVKQGAARAVPAVVPERGRCVVEQLMEDKIRVLNDLLLGHTKSNQHSAHCIALHG